MTDSGLRKSAVGALLLALAALNACTYWHGDLERIVDQTERDFRRDPSKVYKETELSTITANPTGFKHVDVRFSAIMNRTGEMAFVPFWTTFEGENFIGFSAWPGEARIWEGGASGRSYPLLFMRKDNPGLQELISAPRFSLIRVSGRVMGDFEQMAWIDVLRVDVVDPEPVYTVESLASYAVAQEALEQKKPAVAIRHLEDALKGIWIASSRLQIHLVLARLYEGRGDLEKAMEHFDGALQNDPENAEAADGIKRVKEALAARRAAASGN